MNGRTGNAPARTREEIEARVATIVNTHGPALLKVARRVSLCPEDAEDALQRALEIYWRRAHSLNPKSEAAWLRVVVRNEALSVRQARLESLPREAIDPDEQISDARTVEERAAEHERVERSAEALSHLKRDEVTALMMRADGSSYEQISQELSWTRTKVNRALTEGRARFFRVFRGIESGEQCERFAPMLEQLAAGALESDQMMALRPHLRHCRVCRATVRHLHTSMLQRAAALLPIPALLRPSHLKAELYGLFGRFGHTADPALATSAGSGGRSVGAVALVGLCLGGAGAGGYCIATGKLPDPVTAIARDERQRETTDSPRPTPRAVAKLTSPGGVARPARVAPDTSVSQPPRATSRPDTAAKKTSPARRTPKRRKTSEFAFENTAPAAAPAGSTPTQSSPAPAPAPAPSTGSSGGEFAFEQ